MAIGRPIEQTPNIADKVVTATATAGQTEFTVTGGYRVNHLAVFRNGVRLVNGNDFTALDGVTVTLMEDAANLDILEFQVFDSFSISDALLTNSASQTVNGDVTVNGTFTVGSGGIGTFVAAEVNVGIVSSNTGITTVQSLQASSSTTTGALQVKGGVGIGKSLYVGGNVSVGGTLTYEDVTNVDSVGLVTAGKGVRITTGGLVVTAGVSTFAGITTVTNTAALHSKQLNVSAGSTFGGAVTLSDTLTVAGAIDANGALDVDGQTDLDVLNVSDTATFAGDVSIAEKLVHTGNTNTNLTFGSNSITLNSAGTLALHSDSSARVGFGTNDPQKQVDVYDDTAGTLRVSNASKSADFICNATGALVRTIGSYPLVFNTNQTDIARFDASGRFLIGTTTEGNANADNLTVADSSACGISIRSGTTSTGNVYFSDATSGSGEFAGAVEYDHSSNSLRLHSNSDERLRINSSGSTGIGTISPDRTLSVHKDATARINIKSLANSTAGLEFGDTADSNAGYIVYDNTDDTMQFGVNAGLKMIISSAGKLGIGQASPTRQLTVESNGGQLAINDTDNTQGEVFCNAGDFSLFCRGNSNLGDGSTAGYFTVYTHPASGSVTKRLTISSTGNAAFSSSSPVSHSSDASVEIGNVADKKLVLQSGSSVGCLFNKNVYYDGSTYKYVGTGEVGKLQWLNDGGLSISNAVSGSAGNAVTFNKGDIYFENAGSQGHIVNFRDTTSGNAGVGVTMRLNPSNNWNTRYCEIYAHNNGSNLMDLHFKTCAADTPEKTLTLYRKDSSLGSPWAAIGNEDGDAQCKIYPIHTSAAASSTKTVTISGLSGGTFQIALGGYSNAGQSSWHGHWTLGGFMTGTNMYNVTELANWISGGSVSTTKNASNFQISVTNNSGSYTLNLKGYAIGGSGANLTISYS